MPSRSNPNTPSKFKRKTAGVLKSKRKNIQRLATANKSNRISKKHVPRTSQALRQTAPLSRKKERKLVKKEGYARQRKDLEKYLEADVDMTDLDRRTAEKNNGAETGKGDAEMEVD
ncbi:MAG: hypothetical protein L6R39_006325 [Caloplaca ligustica]|nr:MAG: hypothetical protein L6R39_006325 [Caloplaca ligustica]